MKKTLILMLVLTLMILGCSLNKEPIDETENLNNEKEINNETDPTDNDKETLEKKFENEALAILNERDSLLGDDEDERTYIILLENLGKYFKKDISMYVNTKTGKPCNGSESMVIFTVSRVDGKITTTTDARLVCPE